jgi:hypothetical protein
MTKSSTASIWYLEKNSTHSCSNRGVHLLYQLDTHTHTHTHTHTQFKHTISYAKRILPMEIDQKVGLILLLAREYQNKINKLGFIIFR